MSERTGPQWISAVGGLLVGLAAVFGTIIALRKAGDDPPASPRVVKTCKSGFPGPDDAGVAREAFRCNVFQETNTYAEPDRSSEQEGERLSVGSHWFTCQRRGGENPPTRNGNGTANSNEWWLRTRGGSWTPATFIAQGGDDEPVPGVPVC